MFCFFSVLGPINLSAKLQLNAKPELDEVKYSIPKIVLNVVLEKLAIGNIFSVSLAIK